MSKIKGLEVYWMSEKQNVAVTYNRFGLGSRYNLYHKAVFEKWCGDLGCHWEYVTSFDTLGEATRYARKVPDIPVERGVKMPGDQTEREKQGVIYCG